MKRILGLDLGVTSIGWALVEEGEARKDNKIIKLGVRVNPLSADEKSDFQKGKSLSVNEARTTKRSARRNLQRFKLRRKDLIQLLTTHGLITSSTVLTELGANTTHQTLAIRAKAAAEEVSKEELARVLLMLNKKRGYKSSRKVKNTEDGNAIDGMAIAKRLYEEQLTPGGYVHTLLTAGNNYIPQFYRSDLKAEFDQIWSIQQKYYPTILTQEFYDKLEGQGQRSSIGLFKSVYDIETAENKGKRLERNKMHYQWRSLALKQQLSIAEVAYVLVAINNDINKSSGYLGAISDRSKALYFNNLTVGQYLYAQLQKDRHTSLKNKVFYRQDYLDEFEKIWETQAQYHGALTPELKEKMRDVVIFYQRKLKSQKHLISNCQFEYQHKAIPKSSPLFQEFKIWQQLNNSKLIDRATLVETELNREQKQLLFEHLNIKGSLKADAVLKLLGLAKKTWSLNHKEGLEGNSTNKVLFEIYEAIVQSEGYGFDWDKKSPKAIMEEVTIVFENLGIDTRILTFNASITHNAFDKQPSYQFWHLLYAAEDDDKIKAADKAIYGNVNVALKKKLHQKFGFSPLYAHSVAEVSLPLDYGNLSAKAIKKILPHLKNGIQFSEACKQAGYRHSNHQTAEERDTRTLASKLELVKKNSLRNPVVEKILNQMVNLVNQIIETYGSIDEVRIELARELKHNAKERDLATKRINEAKRKNDAIRKKIQDEDGIKHPSKNDLIRFKLYEELASNGYKTLYTNTYIPREKLFTEEIEVEHILPKALVYDDSFSNKTLAFSAVNKDKSNKTAIDFIESTYQSELDTYTARVESFFKANGNRSKYNKLLMKAEGIPNGFIERDLRNSQYIAKAAKSMLEKVVREVNTTSGSVTAKLRDDWGLVDIMKELNMPKYRAAGLTELQERGKGKNTRTVEKIRDWTKRNDHRHHAMDALTVAFTSTSHVHYFNRNSANGKTYDGLTNKLTKVYASKNGTKKRKFIAPITNFRGAAQQHLETILVSHKAKNKVVTKNKNKIKIKGKIQEVPKVQLTPRGQLHNDTVYAQYKAPVLKMEKVSVKFTEAKINTVTRPKYRTALLQRLREFDNDPKKAFSGKNSLSKQPIYIDQSKGLWVPDAVQTKNYEISYTIRKAVNPDNFKDAKALEKIIDQGIKQALLNRLKGYGGDAKKAFSDLDKQPIWLNKEAGISIKKVRIKGIKNAIALRPKRDHLGNTISRHNKAEMVDFVNTGNNHHVAVFMDANGKIQERVVSLFEAVTCMNTGVPVVDVNYNASLGWTFLFTMKQNEMFLFPEDDFNPTEIDLKDPKYNALISNHLYRVQKLSSKDYYFRHHLETTVDEVKALKGVSYKRLSPGGLEGVVKVRLDHLGQIVHLGEY